MAIIDVNLNSNTLSVGIPSEVDIKRLICALMAGDINNLMMGPLICINGAVDDLLNRLGAGSGLAGALGALQGNINNIIGQSDLGSIMSRLGSGASQLSSLYGLGGACPSPISLPGIGNMLGNLVAGYLGNARNVINDLGMMGQALNHICLGAGGTGYNWNNITSGILYNLNQDLNNFGNVLPDALAAQYIAQLGGASISLGGISATMAGGVGSDAAAVAAAASRAMQLNGLYKQLGDYPITDGNMVYDNIFKLFLDPNVYDALIAAQNGGASLITETQNVLDNCGRVISTQTVVVQGDLAAQPFDTKIGAVTTTIPTPALGDFKVYETDGMFSVNVLQGSNPTLYLIKGRSYSISLDLTTTGFNVYNVDGTQYNTGLYFEDGSAGQYAQNKMLGFLTWNIPQDAPDILVYKNSSQSVSGNIVLRSISAITSGSSSLSSDLMISQLQQQVTDLATQVAELSKAINPK